MSDEELAPGGESEDSFSVITPASDAPDTFNSISQAARALVEARGQAPEKVEPEELPDEGNGDPETDPAEEPEAAKPEDELPPLEPPRSWTQAEKERFQSLPRETQEYLSTREQEREREFRRGQNELADQRKAIEAERQKAEQARQQYESQLPALMQELQKAQQSSFADIKTVDDVEKLASEDPFRYLQWQAHQTKLQAVNAEITKAESEKTAKKQSERIAYEQEQTKLLIEMVPEMADPKKAVELQSRAVAMLTDDLGLKNDQLSRWMQSDIGHEILSNAGIQKLIVDRLTLKNIQSAKTAVVTKPLPPVQRPGTAKTASGNSERIQALTEQLNKTGSLKVAQELRALQSQRR